MDLLDALFTVVLVMGLAAIVLGLAPAWIAHRKGRSFLFWWLLGTVFWIAVFLLVLMGG